MKENCFKAMYDHFCEYCEKSTLHGVTYLGERGRRGSKFEKIVWIVFISISFYLCGIMIAQSYSKWMSTPIIIGVAQKPMPVWSIPFPAVTVCPLNKVKRTMFNHTAVQEKYEDFLKRLKKNNSTNTAAEALSQLTEEEIEDFQRVLDLNLICHSEADAGAFNLTKHDRGLYLEQSSLDFFANVSSDGRYHMAWSHFYLFYINSHHFTPILTKEGICKTFNMLDRDEIFTDTTAFYRNYMKHQRRTKGWTVADGYAKNETTDGTYPYRDIFISDSIIHKGLNLELTFPKEDMDYACNYMDRGVRIYFHHPADLPTVAGTGTGGSSVLVPPDHEAIVGIVPETVTTSEELRTYPADVRRCYYPFEKRLTHFKFYTQANCESECLANYTRRVCGCVAFYMPRTNATKICGYLKHSCVLLSFEIFTVYKVVFYHNEENIDNLLSNELKQIQQAYRMKYRDEIEIDGNPLTIKECRCLPTCNAITYKLITDVKPMDYGTSKYKSLWGKPEKQHIVKVQAAYRDNRVTTLERTALYGSMEFLGNCGGLLGVFTGFSFLSVVEILYFVTLRIWNNFRRDKKQNRRVNDDLII